MPRETPQALVTERRSWGQRMAAPAIQQKLTAMPPKIVTANGEAAPMREGVAKRFLHNLGTNAVKYLIDTTPNTDATVVPPNCAADNFHDVLAGGSVVDDGLGSLVEFPVKSRISILGVGGNPRVAVIEYYEFEV